MRDRLSIQLSTDKKEKDHILEVYKKHSIKMAGRVLNFIRSDIKTLEGENKEENSA